MKHFSVIFMPLLLSLMFASCASDLRNDPVDIEVAESEPPTEAVEEWKSVQNTETVTDIFTASITTGTDTVTETEKETTVEVPVLSNIAVVPRLSELSLNDAVSALEQAGVSYGYEYQNTIREAGHLLRVRFHGTIALDGYEIDRDYPVTLVVSAGPAECINVKTSDPNRIYLTFDDGPSTYTPEVLEILEEHGIKATFFMVGYYVENYPELVKEVLESGHVIGCHSSMHEYDTIYESTDTLNADLDLWKSEYFSATGEEYTANLFRFPGGSNTSHLKEEQFPLMYETLREAGFRAFDWTCADNDKYLNDKPENMTVEDYLLQCGVESVSSLKIYPTRPRIMLLHDTSEETVAILDELLTRLEAAGYTFGTLDELDGSWLFRGQDQ